MNKRRKAHNFGIKAEKIACLYLRCKLYHILAERYRNGGGEIDIIATRGKLLVAVEVKARKNIEDCAESVTPWKQQKIARALEGFMAGLAQNRIHDIRFDVIWVMPGRLPTHIKDAWRM